MPGSDLCVRAGQRADVDESMGATGVVQAPWVGVSLGRVATVELGHELAVGGAGGGEVLVAFGKLETKVGGLLFEGEDALVEFVDVGGSAEPGLAPGIFAQHLR